MCGPCAFPTRTGAVFVWADSRGFVLKNENEKARYASNKAKKLKIKKGQQEDATRAIALAAPLRGARIPARFSAESPPGELRTREQTPRPCPVSPPKDIRSLGVGVLPGAAAAQPVRPRGSAATRGSAARPTPAARGACALPPRPAELPSTGRLH